MVSSVSPHRSLDTFFERHYSIALYGKLGGWAERSSRPEVLARNNFHRGNEYFKEGTIQLRLKFCIFNYA